jgi:hypothetical protein
MTESGVIFMKHTAILILSLALTVSTLSACGSNTETQASEAQSVETQQSMTAQIEAVTEQPEQSPAADTQEPTTPPETQEPQQEVTESEPAVEEQQPDTVEVAEVELFNTCEETVYATSTVNIRASYSTDSEKLGSLNYSQSITRLGTGISGTATEKWSKVEFNGETAYIYSEYLSTTKPAVTTNSNKGSSSGKSSSSGQSSSQSSTQTSTTGSQSSNSSKEEQKHYDGSNLIDQEWLNQAIQEGHDTEAIENHTFQTHS